MEVGERRFLAPHYTLTTVPVRDVRFCHLTLHSMHFPAPQFKHAISMLCSVDTSHVALALYCYSLVMIFWKFHEL